MPSASFSSSRSYVRRSRRKNGNRIPLPSTTRTTGKRASEQASVRACERDRERASERTSIRASERASERAKRNDGESEREQKRDRDKESLWRSIGVLCSTPCCSPVCPAAARHRPSRRSQEHIASVRTRLRVRIVTPPSPSGLCLRARCMRVAHAPRTHAAFPACRQRSPLSICLSFYDFFSSILLRFFFLPLFSPGIFHVSLA